MSEQQGKHAGPQIEAVENIEEQAQESAPVEVVEKKEKVRKSKKSPAKKSKKRRRRKQGVPALLVIFLIILSMLFGVVLGYGLGRNNSSDRLEDARDQIDELRDMVVEAEGEEIDVFTDQESAENAAALNLLSGEVPAEDDGQADAMMSGEAFIIEDEENEKQPGTEEVIVAEFKGGSLTSTELTEEYNRQMTGLIFAGFNEEDMAASLLEEVMEYMVSDRVLRNQADKLGLLEVTSADKALIETEARASFNEQVDYYRSHVRQDGMSQEEITAAAQAHLAEAEGVTYETVYEELLTGWWSQKLYEQVIASVQVESSAVLELYQTLLQEQKANFTAYPDDFEYAQRNGETILYNLPGYRAVKLLMIGFEDEDVQELVQELEEEMATLDPQKDMSRISEIQNRLNTIYATPEAQAQSVLEKLNGGADFDAMLLEYGSDEGMKNKAQREMGYYVSADSLLWDKSMCQAAMALEKSGDISPVVRTTQGVCILSYIGEVAPGDVPMSQVTEALKTQALHNAQLVAYETQIAKWLEEAQIKYYPERMQ